MAKGRKLILAVLASATVLGGSALPVVAAASSSAPVVASAPATHYYG